MARGKAVAEAGATSSSAAVERLLVAAPTKRSRLPNSIQFPLVVILSFAFTSLGYSFVNQWTGGELAAIARTLENSQVAILALWTVCELGLGWFSSFDSYDLAALSLLSHGPTLYLLTSFYSIELSTAALCLSVDVLSSFLPFLLLRPLSGAHSAAAAVPNRELIVDRTILAYTSLLAGAIYTVTLSVAYKLFLPKTLVLYFQGIPSIEPARSATSFLFVSAPAAILALLFGLAARTFIFTPFTTTGPAPDDAKIDAFDPVNASLQETVSFNLWGYTARAKVAIQRTAVAMAITGIHTYLHASMTINGVESYGAAVYASVWVVATLFTGLGLAFVGRD